MILVTGAGGQLGSALRARLGSGRATFVGRETVDLERPERLAECLADFTFDQLVNCAAYTAVDAAEEEEQRARRINGEAVGVLARIAAERSAGFVTFSTDYVFDGRSELPYVESDPTGPLNAYGRSKRVGEELALDSHPGALIIRTSWLLSGTHRNFLTAILGRAREGSLEVVDDQHGCPTFAADLAASVLAAIDAGLQGVLHLTNRGETTWYQLARAAVATAGMDPEKVRPCGSERFPRPAPRPSNSVLGSERRSERGVPELPGWRDGLAEIVEELTKRPPD